MKNYLPYLLVVTSTIIFTLFLIDNENKVQKLEQQIQMQNIHHDSLNNCIDSLYHEIDTLLIDLEIWDYNITNNTTHLLSAIIRVESSGNDSAYNASEDAVGCLQIRKCMVDGVE